MIFKIKHSTSYNYNSDVKYSIQYLKLTPQQNSSQRIIDWKVITPSKPQEITDGFNNKLHVLTVEKKHKELEIIAEGSVEITGLDVIGHDGIDPIFYLRETSLTTAGEEISKFVEKYNYDMRSISESLKDMSAEILKLVPYDKTKTNTQTTAEEAFKLHGGVCQDHSHIFISCCRKRNIPARYVSGYFYTTDLEPVSSHAWVEVFFDGSWHTFDVSNQLTQPSQHIKLAVGLDYLSVCPIRGMRIGGDKERMQTETIIEKISSY